MQKAKPQKGRNKGIELPTGITYEPEKKCEEVEIQQKKPKSLRAWVAISLFLFAWTTVSTIESGISI